MSAMAGRQSLPKHLLLTGSIKKLDRKQIGSRLHFDCEVNVVVVKRAGGQMQAILSGRASSFTDYPSSQEEEKKLLARVVKLATKSAVDQLKTNSIM